MTHLALLTDADLKTWFWWLPPHYSSFGVSIDHLFLWIFWITMVTFVAVEGVLVWFCLKYRKNPLRKAVYTHGSHKLEVAWTIIPTIIFVIIGIASNDAWAWAKNPTSSRYPRADEFKTTLKITAQQFAWHVYYPGADQQFDTDDDFSKDNFLVIPWEEPVSLDEPDGPVKAQENVNVKLASQDVIHSLFIPTLRVKQDAVPGFVGNVWFDCHTFTGPGPDGKYWFENPPMALDDDQHLEVACAELCGMGHYTMRMVMKVLPRAKYDEWIKFESANALKLKGK